MLASIWNLVIKAKDSLAKMVPSFTFCDDDTHYDRATDDGMEEF